MLAAGIERRGAFLKVPSLLAGRVGELFVAADIAKSVGVDTTTVQSWVSLLETNGVVLSLPAYYSNLNKRLTKAPKYYFYDVSLATRLQGWTTSETILTSPAFGHLFENIAIGEIARFFLNKGIRPNLSFVRSKEKVEVDVMIDLGDQRFIAAEVKSSSLPWTKKQHELVDELDINIVEKWVVSPRTEMDFEHVRSIGLPTIAGELEKFV